VDELRRKGLEEQIEVFSCGITAKEGAPPTSEALFVMKNREIDISEHRSHGCTREDVREADLILAMSQEHADFVLSLDPTAKVRLVVLNVPDPIGMGMMAYEEVIRVMETKLKENWSKIVS
jgi:protein-tyrosine phosphatase